MFSVQRKFRYYRHGDDVFGHRRFGRKKKKIFIEKKKVKFFIKHLQCACNDRIINRLFKTNTNLVISIEIVFFFLNHLR